MVRRLPAIVNAAGLTGLFPLTRQGEGRQNSLPVQAAETTAAAGKPSAAGKPWLANRKAARSASRALRNELPLHGVKTV